MRILLRISLVLFTLFVPLTSLHAQQFSITQTTAGTYEIQGEHIVSMDTSMDIMKNGTVEVTEKILYDFDTLEKHGIYREIPYVKTNAEGKKFKLDINLESVTDENSQAYHYSTTDSDDSISVKVGDADRTITGRHTYVITYLVAGALTYFNDHDELYWNVTGNHWNVPISTSSAVIKLPEGAQNVTTKCYTGLAGSTASDCTATAEANIATMSTSKYLDASNGFTIVAGFPKGLVAQLEPKQVVNFFDTTFGRFIGWILLLGGTLFGIWWYIWYPISLVVKWWKSGRDPKSTIGEVEAWFEPPKTTQGRVLRPAETGVLIDESADFADVSATIVDLAQRGFLKIEERSKGDFYFTSLGKSTSILLPYEQTLLDGIFEDGDEARVKDLELYDTIVDVKNKMYTDSVKQGYFPENPSSIRNFYSGIAVAAISTVNIPLFLSAIIFGRNLTHRTVSGVDAFNVSKSLKNFLSSQERQLQFQAKNQMMFEKLLPYAVAFQVEKVWADRFKDIKLKQPDWYQGYNGNNYNSALFVHSLNSSFGKVQAVSMPPASSSSGFSSGFSGGSSGGGGGGGGGGSW